MPAPSLMRLASASFAMRAGAAKPRRPLRRRVPEGRRPGSAPVAAAAHVDPVAEATGRSPALGTLSSS